MYKAVIFPDTKIQLVSRVYQRRPCPDCGRPAKRRSEGVRQLRHIGINYPIVLEVHYSKHYCPVCGKYFNAPMDDLAEPGSLFTNAVKDRAMASVFIDQLPLQKVVERMLRDFYVHIPLATLHQWVVEAGGKIDLKKHYEPWVVENFSGYLCIDEVYDGAYVIYYAVDPVSQCRVAFQISYEANEEETRRFLIYLKEMGLQVAGITTDGSHLYPKPLAEIFPRAKHQICYFHILKEINRLVLRCLARFRKSLPRPPKRSRGRPRQGQRYRLNRLEKLRREIWEARYLWVQHYLTPAQSKKLQRLYRGQPFLCALRELVDLVYGLFDRRCGVESARQKLEQLRQKKLWQEFPLLLPIRKKLRSPNLEKALTFLDDDLLEGTSNAVERVNRGHRKFQKTIYRVRTERTIAGRIKYSMLLDRQRACLCVARRQACLCVARRQACLCVARRQAGPESSKAGFIHIWRDLRYAS